MAVEDPRLETSEEKHVPQERLHRLRRWLVLVGAAYALTTIALVGLVLSRHGSERGIRSVRQSEKFAFIDPLVECDGTEARELAPFKSDLTALIERRIDDKQIVDASVYFRDLDNGPWVGVNQDHRFAPASMLKLPILIAYLRWANSDPSILKRQIVFERRGADFHQNIAPRDRLLPGATYTIEALLSQMIIESDNETLPPLSVSMEDAYMVEKTCRLLGLENAVGDDQGDVVTTREMGGVFRMLFNATILTRESSEKALSLLSKVKFRDGLVAGVPPGVVVAHKFGERGGTELHDCGIVYYPKYPYLLCVMVKGERMKGMSDTIRDISALVYGKVSASDVIANN